eukprot:jgi/Botrbrau1/9358/Bobra.354_2s0015.1
MKGWAAFAGKDVPLGGFVCLYAGELLSSKEAESRLRDYDAASASSSGHALLVVREILPSGKAALRINIDATRKGNAARFFNHSCDGGNLQPLVVRSVGDLLPRVALFASRDIHQGEELTFAYGPPNPCAVQAPTGHALAPEETVSKVSHESMAAAAVGVSDEPIPSEPPKTALRVSPAEGGLDLSGLVSKGVLSAVCQNHQRDWGTVEASRSPREIGDCVAGSQLGQGGTRKARICLCGADCCLGYLPCSM